MRRTQTHQQQSEHGLSDVEAVPPVVIGDVTVSFPNCVHPSCQDLHDEKRTRLHVTPEMCNRHSVRQDYTSAGTLNFSTTPSSKKQRMPHSMSSNSDKGKSLKRNSSSSTFLASGILAFCNMKTIRRALRYKLCCEKLSPDKSQCLPAVCTSPSGHSLLVQNQTFSKCSVGE